MTDDPFSSQDAESTTVNGLLTSSKTSTGLTYSYGHDGLERRTSVIDPRTGASTTHYNAKGQVDWTQDAAGNQTSYTYDSDTGRRIAVTRATGTAVARTVQYQYDIKGQLEKVYGDTEPVDYGNDDYGRRTSMTTYRDGGAGDTTNWVYEEATGLLLEKVYPDGNKTTYTYTPEGQLLTRLWARGVDTTYTRDPATGDLTLIDYSDATPNVSMSYDSRGRPSTISDGLGTRTLTYGTGSLLSADSLTGVTHTYTDGRLTGLSPGADYGVSYSYDTYGRFGSLTSQVAGTGTQTYTYSYLPNSDLLESLTTSHGLSVTRSYEPNRDVLMQVQNTFNSNVISQYDYTYDALRRRTSMTTDGTAIDTMPQSTVPEQDITYTTNALNQYTQISTGEGDDALVYDLDGSLTNDGTFRYAYDAENRLISATPLDTASGLKKVEFVYDYMSRQVNKKVSTYTAGTWNLDTETVFVYDGWHVIKEQTTTRVSTSTTYYVWGLDLSGSLQGAGGIGGLLMRVSNTGNFLYLYDANGNGGQLVNAADGSVAVRYKYAPFGRLLVSDGPEAEKNPYRFSTKRYHAEIGWYDYGRRYYSPVLGRWQTRDPIGEKGGLNLYGFVGNNPANGIDFLGLRWDVFREGEAKAEARSCNDTVMELAKKVGLSPFRFRKWLTSADGLPLPNSIVENMGNRRFYIPNTVYAYWGGHLIWFGRWHTSWNMSISYLRKMGFYVVEKRHVFGGRFSLSFALFRLANNKELHGLYFWGHGDLDGLYGGRINLNDWPPYDTEPVLLYNDNPIQNLPYKMALGLVFACDSNAGRSFLYSHGAGGIWHGYTHILVPVFGNFHVKHWIKPGDQETQSFKLYDDDDDDH